MNLIFYSQHLLGQQISDGKEPFGTQITTFMSFSVSRKYYNYINFVLLLVVSVHLQCHNDTKYAVIFV